VEITETVLSLLLVTYRFPLADSKAIPTGLKPTGLPSTLLGPQAISNCKKEIGPLKIWELLTESGRAEAVTRYDIRQSVVVERNVCNILLNLSGYCSTKMRIRLSCSRSDTVTIFIP